MTTWSVMALKEAGSRHYMVPDAVWEGAKKYLDGVTSMETGQVGFDIMPAELSTGPSIDDCTMTACGVLSRIYMKTPCESEQVKKGVEHLERNRPKWEQSGVDSPFFFYWYVNSLAMFQMSKPRWSKWSKGMDSYLYEQQVTQEGGLRGSWNPTPDRAYDLQAGRVYSTSMAVLCLEVRYRFTVSLINEEGLNLCCKQDV